MEIGHAAQLEEAIKEIEARKLELNVEQDRAISEERYLQAMAYCSQLFA